MTPYEKWMANEEAKKRDGRAMNFVNSTHVDNPLTFNASSHDANKYYKKVDGKFVDYARPSRGFRDTMAEAKRHLSTIASEEAGFADIYGHEEAVEVRNPMFAHATKSPYSSSSSSSSTSASHGSAGGMAGIKNPSLDTKGAMDFDPEAWASVHDRLEQRGLSVVREGAAQKRQSAVISLDVGYADEEEGAGLGEGDVDSHSTRSSLAFDASQWQTVHDRLRRQSEPASEQHIASNDEAAGAVNTRRGSVMGNSGSAPNIAATQKDKKRKKEKKSRADRGSSDDTIIPGR